MYHLQIQIKSCIYRWRYWVWSVIDLLTFTIIRRTFVANMLYILGKIFSFYLKNIGLVSIRKVVNLYYLRSLPKKHHLSLYKHFLSTHLLSLSCVHPLSPSLLFLYSDLVHKTISASEKREDVCVCMCVHYCSSIVGYAHVHTGESVC